MHAADGREGEGGRRLRGTHCSTTPSQALHAPLRPTDCLGHSETTDGGSDGASLYIPFFPHSNSFVYVVTVIHFFLSKPTQRRSYIPTLDVSAGSNSLGAQRKYFWIRFDGDARIYSRRLVTMPAAVTCSSLANRLPRLRGLSQCPRRGSRRARALETRQALPPSLPRPLAPVLGAPRRRRLLAPAFLGHSVSRVAAAKRRRCAQARHKSISMANQAQSDDSRGRRGEETREGKHPKHRGSRGKEGRKEGI